MTERSRCPKCDSHSCTEFGNCKWEQAAENMKKATASHEDTCCRLHGCLLDGNCPVEVGGVIQKGPCDLCPPVGKVGWDNGTADVLRAVAAIIDNNSAENPETPWVTLPHLGDVMRRLKGRCNPKLVVQLLHVLGGTENQQTSASLRPIGVDSSLEMELELQVEAGDAIQKGSVFISRDMWEEMTKMFDRELGIMKMPAFAHCAPHKDES